MRIDFPYLMVDRDRHDNERIYVRRHGRKVRIKAKLGSEAFAQAYADALHAIEHGDSGRQADHQGRSGGHAGLAGGLLFSLTWVQGPRHQVEGHPPADHRRMPSRAPQAKVPRYDAGLPAERAVGRARSDATGSQGRNAWRCK